MKNPKWYWIRWIGILPSAILAAGIFYLFFDYTYSFFLEGPSWVVKYLIPLICSGISGVVFIVVGVKVAPTHKVIVARILLGIIFLSTGAGIYLYLIKKEYLELTKLIISLLGSIVTYIQVKNEKILTDL